MKLKKLLFFLVLLYSFSAISQTAETLNLYKNKETTIKNWEVYFIQNPLSTYQNSKPVSFRSSEITDSTGTFQFKGVCWFRKLIRTDSTFHNKQICFVFNINGAAEIFINKQLIKEIGTVSDNATSEQLVNSSDEMVFVNLDANMEYEILVRYSNHNLISNYNKKKPQSFGFTISIKNSNTYIADYFFQKLIKSSFGVFLLAFFLTLCLVHFTIFLFNKYELSNLYYSGLCFVASIFIFTALSSNYSTDAAWLKSLNLIMTLCPILIFCILPYMFRSFFKMKFPRWYIAIIIAASINILLLIFKAPFRDTMILFLIAAGSVESIRVLTVALKQKKQGVKILGFGLLLFMVLIGLLLTAALLGAEVQTNNSIIGILLIIFLILSICSIPISITIFLAYSILLTNKSLSKKLIEVEELSVKNLEQEKEKQHILENQKTILEVQVKERTFEINEQKKVIEEKNKDIIDSINYAKRIQSAMLPDESAFNKVFENSFVLYQPRDIVSGDFYYATDINEAKLIIAADCTGHGVPGALMSMVGSNIINKLIHENNFTEPKVILEKLHIQLRNALKQDLPGSDNRDGMDICAVLIDKDIVKYAGANRPLIWFGKEHELNEIKPTKTPIGGSHISSVEIEQHQLFSSQVKQLFLFSDGFADQFGGPDGKKLMISRFKSWLHEIINLPAPEQKKILNSKFCDWKQKTEQVDDVMVIGIRV